MQLTGLDVADPDHFGPARLVQVFERRPDFPIFFVETPAAIGSVQDIGIDAVGVQVFERAFKRLRDLFRYGSHGVIGRSVVLPRDRRKLGLQEQLIPRDPLFRQGKQGLSDQGFVVVDDLVCGIDGAKAGLDGRLHVPAGVRLFPRRAVHEGRDGNAVVCGDGLHGSCRRLKLPGLHQVVQIVDVQPMPDRVEHAYRDVPFEQFLKQLRHARFVVGGVGEHLPENPV